MAGIGLLIAAALFAGLLLHMLDRFAPAHWTPLSWALTNGLPLLLLGLLTLGFAALPGGSGRVYAISASGSPTTIPTLDQPLAPFSWGWNSSGQLGDGGITSDRNAPNSLLGLGAVRAVAAGGYHSLVALEDGTVWAWGRNNSGQVGDSTTTTRFIPVQIAGLGPVSALAGGSDHSLALGTDGTVWAWGRNTGGQLGDGTTTNRRAPVQVPGVAGAVAIAAGGTHSLALLGDGTVLAWGSNGSGQLGDGTLVDRLSPTAVPGLGGVTAITANLAHSLALKADGTVWGWGSNANYRLGVGAPDTERRIPTQLPDLAGVTAIAAGGNHGLAVKGDGTAWAWGDNAFGSVGDGTRDPRPTAVPVSGLGGIAKVAAGLWQSFAVTREGAIWVWGYNEFGTLGRGTVEVDRDVPGRLPALHGVQALAAWGSHSLAIAKPLPYDVLHNCAPSTPWAARAGDGICASFGTFSHGQTDLAVPGRGTGLALARTHHSADPTDSGFGPGWSFGFGMSVHAEADGVLLVRMGDGRLDRYTRAADGTYVSPGLYHRLVRSFNGTTTLTTHDQFVHVFDNQGRLVSIADRNNNTTTLAYTATALTITEPAGRQFVLTYGTGVDYGRFLRLEEVNILGRVVQYTYDSGTGDLTSVTDPRSHLVTMLYDRHRLKTVTNQESERVVDNLYATSTGKVTFQQDAKGNATLFDYTQLGRTIVDGPRTDVPDVTTFEYDEQFRLMKVLDPLSGTTEIERDTNNNPTCVADRLGGRTRYEYDLRGNVKRVVDARYTGADCDGPTATTAEFNTRNDPFVITNARGFPTYFDYNGAGNLEKIRRPLGRNTTYEYDPSGNGDVVGMLDADNFRTSYEYNQWGQVSRIGGPGYAGGATSIQRDAGGRLLGTVGALGQVSAFEHNPVTAPRAVVTQRTYPSATETLATETIFDWVGRVDKVTDPRGAVTNYVYEPNGNLERVIAAANKAVPERATTRYEYDSADNLTAEIEVDGNGTTNLRTVYSYDSLGRTLTINPPGNIGQTTYLYLDGTRQVQRTVPSQGTSTATYDQIGQVRRIDYPPNGGIDAFAVEYDYDENGNRTLMLDQHRPVGTTYLYDQLDRLLIVKSPLVIRTETRQVEVQYRYDINNSDLAGAKNCLQVDYPTIPGEQIGSEPSRVRSVTSCLDTAGRLARVVDWRGYETRYGYDAAGRLQTATNDNGVTFSSYGYDGADRLKTIEHYRTVLPAVVRGASGVDGAANAHAGTPAATPVATPAVPGLPRFPSWPGTPRPVRPAATPAPATPTPVADEEAPPLWDDELPPLPATLSALAIEPISAHTYTLDGAGNRTAITETTATAQMSGQTIGNGVTTLTYDAQQRLKTVAYPVGDPTPTEGYDYTPGGQRDLATIGGVGRDYQYDGAGRLTDDGQRGYEYYPDGSLKRRTGTTSEEFQYDGAGRLVRHHVGGAITATNFARYDGDGRRLFSDMGVQNVGSIWDVNRALPVVLYEDTQQGHVFYIYGLTLIARVLVDPTQPRDDDHYRETALYFHSDGVGSVRAITNQRGHLLAAYDYTAFGESRRECLRLNAGVSCATTVTAGNPARTNTFKFAGEAADAQTGLSYRRARYYDPSTGRFTQPDPAGSAGGNGGAGYAYAANNPQTYGDPTGMWVESALDAGFIAYDLHQLVTGGREPRGENLVALVLDVAGALLPIATGFGAAYRVGRAGERVKQYSVAFEMTLKAADIGKDEGLHVRRANAAFREAKRDRSFMARLEREIPDIHDPQKWVWHHHADRVGVMQLVPAHQHTKGSAWWRLMHPDGVRGGYELWAVPAGAPPRPR